MNHSISRAAGARFAGGVVLYDGETGASFGDRLHAVPNLPPAGGTVIT